MERAWEALTHRLSEANSAFPERLSFLKCQMGFGWDFAPRLRTIGIWDDVALIVVRSVWIREIRVRTVTAADTATLDLGIELDSQEPVDVKIQIEVREQGQPDIQTTRGIDSTLKVGLQDISVRLVLPHPNLWQSWDRGTPHMYDLTVRVTRVEDGNPCTLDTCTQSFGVRNVDFELLPGGTTRDEPWQFALNGQPEFLRGANWVPLDAMPGRLRNEDYERMLDMAREAGINMLRVWGGGLREKAVFYDLCDRKGILVWQDFPFACAFLGYYPRQSGFLDLVRQECTEIVRQLRNHPCLALWCGGNEFSPRRNRRLVSLMRSIVAEHDGTRPFKRVSPDRGEAHNWRIWHGHAAISQYRQELSSVLGEFGLQAVPDIGSLQRFIQSQELWPPGEDWTFHNAELDKLFRYARPLLPPEVNSMEKLVASPDPAVLERFIEASQTAQSHGLQVAIEHIRRRKGHTGGVLLWQLNEPWPSICWSIIDFYRRPKAAYRKLVDVYNPELLSALYALKSYKRGDRLDIELWAINDRLEPVEDATAEAVLDGRRIHFQEVTLPPNSSREIARVSALLDHVPRRLVTRLTAPSGAILSTNEYDLNYSQPSGVSWKRYVISRLVELTLRY